MDSTVDFNDYSDFRTIKVDNVAINWNLAAELQAESSSISQQFPRGTLCTRILMPHLTCSFSEFL